jgi:phosphopantetheinyl transferase (holo-ACP synthase)
MISSGNDIVSLNAINITRTKQYRFYSKILSSTEKALYNQAAFASIPFENFVWLLWSIKESAYKYLKRNSPDLVFIPIKFEVTQLLIPSGYVLANFEGIQMEGAGFGNIPALKGVVTFGIHTLYSASLLYPELIVSVVNGDENFENVCWGVKLIGENEANNQSIEVRKFLIDRLQHILHLDALVMGKTSGGIPVVLNEGEELAVAISLSHHERFVGYSFQQDSFNQMTQIHYM